MNFLEQFLDSSQLSKVLRKGEQYYDPSCIIALMSNIDMEEKIVESAIRDPNIVL